MARKGGIARPRRRGTCSVGSAADTQNTTPCPTSTPAKRKPKTDDEISGLDPKVYKSQAHDKTVDAAVERCLINHFGGCSWAQIMAMTVDGLPVYDKVRADFLVAKVTGRRLAGDYWERLYGQLEGGGVWSDLEPSTPDLPIASGFLQAMSKAHSRNPAEREVRSLACYLRCCERELNAVEFCGLVNGFAKVFRKTCKFTSEYAVAIATYIMKYDAIGTLPRECEAIKNKVDIGLVGKYQLLRRSGLSLHAAVFLHLDAFHFVMPAEPLRRVMQCTDENYGACARDLQTLIKSSACGRAIFGFTVALVAAVQFSNGIDAAIDDFSKSPCSREAVLCLRSDLARFVEESQMDPSCRVTKNITVKFLGISIIVRNKGASFEWELKLTALLKERGLQGVGCIPRLPWEDWCFGHEGAEEASTVDASMLPEATAARAYVNQLIVSSKAITFAQMRDLVTKRFDTCESLDPAWQLEAYFLENQAEERITSRVTRDIFDCLPRLDRAVSVKDASAKLDLLSKASHVADAHVFTAVSRVRVCVEYLEHIGRGLPLDKPPPGDLFLDQVFEQLCYFFQFIPARGHGALALADPIRGIDALKACFAEQVSVSQTQPEKNTKTLVEVDGAV